MQKLMGAYPGRPGVATGFPLFAPFFTLQRMEVLKSVTLKLHFFQAHLHFMCNFQRILALFDTPPHGSVLKCFHFLYTYSTFWRFQHFLTLQYMGVSRSVPLLTYTHCTVSTLPMWLSEDMNTYLHFTMWKCHEVFTLLVHFHIFSTLPTDMGNSTVRGSQHCLTLRYKAMVVWSLGLSSADSEKIDAPK